MFLLMAGMMMSCGKKENMLVEEPKVYAIDSGETREGGTKGENNGPALMINF